VPKPGRGRAGLQTDAHGALRLRLDEFSDRDTVNEALSGEGAGEEKDA
jgi:hypothetical protein